MMALGACGAHTRTLYERPPAQIIKRCFLPVLTGDPSEDVPALVKRISECDSRAAGLIVWADSLSAD
jgi:hypothetical protein